MIVYLKKFGTTLVSRPAGKEAWLAFQPSLKEVAQSEEIIVDFDGVITLTPSWTDEFLTPLQKDFKQRVKLINTDNSSVKATLEILNKSLEDN